MVFYGEGCPYCAAELEFLDGLQDRHPGLTVTAREVWHDAENRALFGEVAETHGMEPRAVPTTFVADRAWVGFTDEIGREIEQAVGAASEGRAPPEDARTVVEVPFLGDVDVGDRSLLAATLLIGFVDGVNPCSLWVLSMLLALVLHSGSRSRILAVGTVFLAVTALLYGLYVVGMYSALDVAGEADWIRLGVAGVAGGLGVLHLKEYVTRRGPSLTIPERRKPGLYRSMRKLADPGRSAVAVLAGTVVLAVGVSLVETPCTAGLPLMWTDLLSNRGVGRATAVLLFGLYLLVFLLDELLVFGAAVVTMRAAKLQERHGRVLQLVSGALMVALASTMLVAPDLLESLTGTAAVFGATAGAVAAILLVDRVRTARRAVSR